MEQMATYNVADTLANRVETPMSVEMTMQIPVNEVSVADILGAQSAAVEGVINTAKTATIIGDTFFQVMAVVLLVIAISFAARNRRGIATIFSRMLRSRLPDDYSSGHRDEVMTRSFMHTALLIGVFIVTLLLVKYLPAWLPDGLDIPEPWLSVAATAGVVAAIVAIWLFEQALLRIIGRVTRNDDTIEALLYLKRAYFAVAAIVMSPVFLLGILSSQNISDVWNIILVVECVILVILFIKETLALFIGKKIPIFHWILYLCAVEVFPLSLIWALVVRS